MIKVTLQHRIQACRQRWEAAPQSRAFAPLADVLRQDGRHEEALVLLEKGLTRHPEFHAALVILGHTLLDADRAEHAAKVLRSVLDRDSENVVALRLLTEDARSRQAWSEAVPWLERLCLLDPDDERWPHALSEARANRNVTDPADVPETSFATLTLVDIYLAQGYRAKAMTALRRMQKREPERQDITERIAEIGILEGAPEPSLQSLAVANAEAVAEGSSSEVMATNADRRALQAAKRAEEKKSFEAWIDRIRTDDDDIPEKETS